MTLWAREAGEGCPIEVTVHWKLGEDIDLGGLVVFTRRFLGRLENDIVESIKTYYSKELEPLAGPWCRERQRRASLIYFGFESYPSEEAARSDPGTLQSPIQEALWVIPETGYRVYGFLWLVKAGFRLFAAVLGIVAASRFVDACLWPGQPWYPLHEAIGSGPGAVIDAASGNIDKIRNLILLRRKL